MLSARDYVEIMTCNRLNRVKDGDRLVSDDEFLAVTQRLADLIYKTAHKDVVPGFDPEDLEGFFHMKVHQVLRRGIQYDNEFSYFAKSFQNIVRNLIAEQETALKRLHADPLITAFLFGDERPNCRVD